MKIKLILPLILISLTKVSTSSSMSETPNELLMRGINEQNSSLIQEALKNGATDVDMKDKHGTTALFIAAREGDLELVQLLLDKNAKVDNQDNNSALLVASLMASMHSNDPSYINIIKLLIKAGADVNKQNSSGDTPLFCYLGGLDDINIVRLFLNKGADLTLKNKRTNEGPLEFARRNKDTENMEQVAKLLEEWQEKHRQTIRKEAGEYLIPDLCDIVGEYALGPIARKN